MEEVDLILINEQLALPAAELQFRFTTGGGPGGQHVNKTATRVTLLFDVAGSPSLDEATRTRLLDRLATRLATVWQPASTGAVYSTSTSRIRAASGRTANWPWPGYKRYWPRRWWSKPSAAPPAPAVNAGTSEAVVS